MPRARIGLWLIGAKGGVATTALTGLTALKKGLIGNAGLVTSLPRFQALDLIDWKDLVVGGHDIRPGRLFDEAMRMHTESRAIDAEILRQCKPELDKIEKNIRPGTIHNVGATIAKFADGEVPKRRETPRDAIERIKHDLESFRKANKLDHTIVVNVASTEPPVDPAALPERWADLNKLLDKPQRCPLAASSLYAIAALDLGCSYINFTPSLGSTPPAIDELALERGTRHMGYDGKTGETLLKSVLAPMFAKRNLEVMSWVGHNIFGNMDGKVLDDPVNKKSKVTSKDRLLGANPRLPAADAGDDRIHQEHGRLENGLGPRPFPRLPRHADDVSIHLARLRFAVGRAAGARSGAVHGASVAPRRRGRAQLSRCLLQEPTGYERARFRIAIRDARTLGR